VFKQSTEVQSLLFDRSKWTVSKAKAWLKSHDFKIPDVDTTNDYHRFRQGPSFQFKAGTFRTIAFGKSSDGIKAVIAVPRKANPTKGDTVPSQLVCLGKCLDIEFSDGTIYEPPGADLCASMSGKTLYVVKRRKATKTRKRNALFEAFHDFDPDSEYIIRIPDNINFKKSKKVRSISYRSNKWTGKNVDYIHRFRSQPTAYSDNLKKPSIIKISGGKIRVKPQGITG